MATKKAKKITKRVKKTVKRSKSKSAKKDMPTLKFKKDQDIALDFATKVYQKFNKLVKSIVLFGSVMKKKAVTGSDIDVVIIVDDVSINWDTDLTIWYRERLEKIIQTSPYQKEIHITTVKLSTWWDDLLRGDPVVINMIRYGETLIDFGGFFEPLKHLLVKGKIKATPEAIHNLLQRSPMHLARSKVARLDALEGLYWSMVDAAHAAIIAIGKSPPSPEHITGILKETLEKKGLLKMKYIEWFRDIHYFHKRVAHGDVKHIKGEEIDLWESRAQEFLKTMLDLVDRIIE